MKRSAIKVGAKSLERGSTFAAELSPLHRTAIKTRPKRRKRRRGFRQLLDECATCAWAGMGDIACGGVIDAHHVIKQQHIERRFPRGAVEIADGHRVPLAKVATGELLTPGLWQFPLGAILADSRNLLAVCRAHHAAHHSAHGLGVTRDLLPAEVFDFAREYGMESQLLNAYPDVSRTAA
jgi:hypothetical protein